MFTGIVQDRGELLKQVPMEAGVQLHIRSSLPAEHFFVGNSIAVDGVCLTVESFEEAVFTVTVVPETLDRTTFSNLEVGQSLNIETPLTPSSPIAGHYVSGHVDAVAHVVEVAPDLKVRVPQELMRFFPVKGSVTLNGVSLTLTHSQEDVIGVALIPETLRATNLGELKEGDALHVEVDLIARYLEHLTQNL